MSHLVFNLFNNRSGNRFRYGETGRWWPASLGRCLPVQTGEAGRNAERGPVARAPTRPVSRSCIHVTPAPCACAATEEVHTDCVHRRERATCLGGTWQPACRAQCWWWGLSPRNSLGPHPPRHELLEIRDQTSWKSSCGLVLLGAGSSRLS